jgi:hypothetical protein
MSGTQVCDEWQGRSGSDQGVRIVRDPGKYVMHGRAGQAGSRIG